LANTAGQDIIRVASVLNIALDTYFALRDQTQPIYSLDNEEPFGLLNGYRGEIVRIREILPGGYIQLHAELEETYAASAVVGDQSDFRHISAVENLTIRNIALDLSKPLVVTNTAVIATALADRPRSYEWGHMAGSG
jgi:hypothetical protein